MSGAEPDRRRESFDAAASDYARFRPSYPAQVVDHLVVASGLRSGSRVLEIGCGTGQLSVPLAQLGVELVAVELGEHLAAIARRQLAGFPAVRVEVADFDGWDVPTATFDVVVAAGALHWIDPSIRFTKPARVLRPGGVLAIVHAHHVSGGTPGFFRDTQPIYQRWGLSDDPHFELPTADEVPSVFPELDTSPDFGTVRRARFEIPIDLTTESYAGWLRTDSLVSTLEVDARASFLHEIAALIDGVHGGRVVRNLVYDVVTATRDA